MKLSNTQVYGTYPYARTFTTQEQAADILLRAVENPTEVYGLRQERISGIFVDQVRTICHRSDEASSPYQYFIDNAQRLQREAKDNPETMDQLIWNDIKGCGAFRPSLLVRFIEQYNPSSILDPCAGWGDRLLAALSMGVAYTGVDPNKLLQYHYQEMIEAFYPPNYSSKSSLKGNSAYIMIEAPFEHVVIKGEYDMVFTSPPFADLEIYSKGQGQSTNAGNMRQWKVNFLYPLLQKSWQHLKKGGVMCMYVAASKKHIRHKNMWQQSSDYVTDMINYMKSITDTPKVLIDTTHTKVNVLVWQKELREMSIDVFMPITLKGHMFDLHRNTLEDRAILDYLRTLDGTFNYIVPPWHDPIIKDLASHVKLPVKLTIHIPEQNSALLQSLQSYKGVTLRSYSEPYIQYKKTVEHLLPYGLDNAEFEALLTVVLQRDLPYVENVLFEPDRLWLMVYSSVTLRALGNIWKNTLFLVVAAVVPATRLELKQLPLQLQRRVTIYSNPNNIELTKLKHLYGYTDDYII